MVEVGLHPIAGALRTAYSRGMKNKTFSKDQTQKPAGATRSAATEALDQKAIDVVVSPDEVARRAYFTYLNEGSQTGREVRHWLAAEAQLPAERKPTRAHGFHNFHN